jgi:long-chain acyl-CoA synthetase
MLIVDPFLNWVDRRPDRAAVVLGNQAVSYADLRHRAEQVAARVRAECGSSLTQARCGLMLNHGIDFIAVFLGIAMSGAAAVVLSPQEPAAARVLLADPPALLFVHSDLARVGPVPAPGIRPIIVRGNSLLVDPALPTQPLDVAFRPVSPDDTFYIGFTSGTTGEPKAFIRSHRSWLASLHAAAIEFPVGADEHVLVPGRLVHSLFLYALMETLCSGATAYLLPDFEAEDGLSVLRRYPISRIHGVPTMYAALCAATTGERFPPVRRVISGGAKLSFMLRPELARMFPEATITEYYGASELSFVSVSHGDCPAESVGRPFHGVEVSLRRDDGSEASPGEIGRLYVRSDMICSGFLRGEDQHRFSAEDGWATVGDRAWRDEDGCIFLAGREDGMMISGGLNVYPAEVETVLQALPEIAEAAVLGLPDPYWGERICAVIRWAGSMTLTRAELREQCSRRLDRRKCPQQVFAIDRFARTRSGKIALAALRKDLLAGKANLVEII